MKSSDIFPSKYLRAADLNGAEPIVTIDRVVTETLGDESKPVMYFKGKDKGLVMNKTNWNAVEELTGEDDSDNWKGTGIKLVTVKVEFQGKRVPAIRIEQGVPKSVQQATKRMEQARGKKAPQPITDNLDEPPVDGIDDSDVPF